jgi:hypothetical protein
MDYGVIIGYLQSALIPLLIFISLLVFAVVRGRRAITSLILGLYFALLISLKFPYYPNIYDIAGGIITEAAISIIVFAVFTAVFSLLMDRLLFYRIDETAFEGFGKKVLLALLATVLVMAYSYHVLPITKLLDPGLPAGLLFAPEEYFFWWLIVPLAGLFFLY